MAKGWKSTPEQRAWAVECVRRSQGIENVLDRFQERYGYRPTRRAVYNWAWNAGVKMGESLGPKGMRAQRRIYWKLEPELDEWMRDNDDGRPVREIMDAFEARWGFRIAYTQVTLWRQQYGTTRKPRHRNEASCKPLGTMRKTKCGYWLVKVRMHPDKPSTRDNWEFASMILWREHHGEIPEGCQLVYVDGNCDNLAIENLHPVPKRLMAKVNNIGWSNLDELKLAIAEAELVGEIIEANRQCTCRVCGKRFTSDSASKARKRVTCPECVKAGRKGKGEPHQLRIRECAICGAEFNQWNARQRRCKSCIDKYPAYSIENAKRIMERRGEI